MGMKVLYERCAGCDVHKDGITVHIVIPEGQETRTFGTTTNALLTLVEWLLERQVTHVAMESTGVYWKPVYNLLEAAELKVFVVNAAHMKAVPGRKTDVRDAAWICDLMRHGLLRPSFIPPRPQRELRELVRYRISLIAERGDEANRIQKVLEGGNSAPGQTWRVQRVRFPPRQGLATHREPSLGLMEVTTWAKRRQGDVRAVL